jgi:hypothetical protein
MSGSPLLSLPSADKSIFGLAESKIPRETP